MTMIRPGTFASLALVLPLAACSGHILASGAGASTGTGGAAGTGGNECTELAAAYTKASVGMGCSSLAAAGMALASEAANCPSTVDAAAVSCYSACISAITSCTSSSVLETYASCIEKCPAT
jgi:hypothetical protein